MIAIPKYGGLCHQLIAGTAASLGVLASGALYGWVSPILPSLLGPDSEIPMTPEEASWMVAMSDFGNIASPLPAGFIADRFGRKTVILAAAPIFIIGWLIILHFKTLLAWNIARLIQGLSVGIVFTVVPTYLGEIASPKYRGAVTSTFFGLWWFGFLFEYVLGPEFSFVNYTYITASTSIIFFVAFLWQPESPYYYLMKNDLNNAHKSLSWLLHTTEEETRKELENMRRCVEEDQKKKVTWKELVATPTDRKALMILFLVGFLRQFSGIIPLSLYSTQTLIDSGDNFFISPDNVTIIMGVLMLIGSLCSSFTIDTFGRKTLLFFSCSISGISMFFTGTFYMLKSHSSLDVLSYSWIPPISMMVLAGVSVVGMFPVSTAYTSELFTSNTRGTASSVFAVYTAVVGFFEIKFYLTLCDVFGPFVNFYIFTLVCLFGTLLTCCVMPETKGKSFEQIRHELQKNEPVL